MSSHVYSEFSVWFYCVRRSMFILYVLELLRWSSDEESLHLYYPTIKRAALWQVSVLEWLISAHFRSV